MRGRQTDTGTGRQGEDRQGESVRERATGRGQTGRESRQRLKLTGKLAYTRLGPLTD